jgi:hypothetical protein
VDESSEVRLSADEIGDYCRQVEDYLTRANAGHLVRIVGPGFDLVRGWARSGVPLSVVFRGIDRKAERHREGAARRPLRIEFCAADVIAVFVQWRRAIGLPWRADGLPGEAAAPAGVGEGGRGEGDAAAPAPAEADAKRPSLTRHLDRAIDRLGRAGGRLDWPVELRDACDRVLQALADMRASAPKLRGAARDAAVARLGPLDAELAAAIRQFVPPEIRGPLVDAARAELAPFRARLSGEAWDRSVDVTADRLLRDRLGLPFLELS